MIVLRPITEADSDNLFAWRNDSLTRANSRTTAMVTRQEHALWLQIRLSDPEHRALIAEMAGKPIGTVRFDNRDKGDEVSITVAPAFRGQGLGYLMLSIAVKDAQVPLIADIRRDNMASRGIFERCQFVELGGAGDFVLYRREPQ